MPVEWKLKNDNGTMKMVSGLYEGDRTFSTDGCLVSKTLTG